MTDSHETIEELLAGYVLRSLSGADAVRADHLLSDHVPSCPACRDSLAVFQGVTADLALAARPLDPPETLLPRLHRDLGSQGPRRRPAAIFAAAASVVAVVAVETIVVAEDASNRTLFCFKPFYGLNIPMILGLKVSQLSGSIFY